MKSYGLVLLLIAMNIIGMALYALSWYMWRKHTELDRKTYGFLDTHDQSDQEETVTESTKTIKTADKNANSFKLTFKVTGNAVEDHANEIIDSMMKVRGFANKVGEDDIVCDMINPDTAKIAIIIHFDGDISDLNDNKAYKKVFTKLMSNDRIKKIKLNEFKKVKTNKQEYVELSFKTKGEDAEDYSIHLVMRMMRNKAFKKKVLIKEVNVMGKNPEIIFILKQDPSTAMEDKTIKQMLDMLKGQERVKKINVKVVEDVGVKRKELNEMRLKQSRKWKV